MRHYSTTTDPTIPVTVRIRTSLWREVQLHLVNPGTGKVAYGAWTHTFEQIVQRWLSEQRPVLRPSAETPLDDDPYPPTRRTEGARPSVDRSVAHPPLPRS